MPAYEYRCDDCNETFTVIASMSEKEKGLQVVCKICGSTNVRQVYSSISVGGKKKDLPLVGGGCSCGGAC
ncbi:MAG: zinc ribbon domain-containing protein [Spirochaetota bacterium]|jgi:putative FmdB family regulatory protein